jgi:L-lactate dehydrogenase (cytochrome)
LTDVSSCDLATQFLGKRRALPFVVAPTAVAGLIRHDGEVLLARAAAAAGVPFCVSTQSTASIEHIAAGAPDAELWFQLYVWRDVGLTWQLLQRAKAAGVSTLVLTVDTPASPKKVHNLRNGFDVPLKTSFPLALDLALHPGWTLGVMGRYLLAGGIPGYAHYPDAFRGPVTRGVSADSVGLSNTLDRTFLSKLRQRWRGNHIIKGILSAEDAMVAVEGGADAIVVSSHGGRNFDSAPLPIEVLPGIVEAVGGRVALFADSGIQRGSDAGKLLALGADGVLLGRMPLYGLAAGAESGARAALDTVAKELNDFCAFAGRPSLAELTNAQLT